MSYRIRFTLPDGRTGHWAREYATREEAERLIGDRLDDTGFAYVVEEVVATAAVPDATQEPATSEARIRELESELAQLRDALAVVEGLGDAMHRAMTIAQTYLSGEWGGVKIAMKEWEAYKEQLAASPQGPAKASGGAGGSAHTGPGHQPGAGQGVASRLIVDLGAIEPEGPAKASEAPGEGGDSGEGAK